jgi:hypothetical protein
MQDLLRRFFEMLSWNHDDLVELASDPHTYELVGHKFGDVKVEPTASNVFYLFHYHSNVLTLKMLRKEIIDAMYAKYDNGRWAEMGRPSMYDIRRRILVHQLGELLVDAGYEDFPEELPESLKDWAKPQPPTNWGSRPVLKLNKPN